MQSTQDCDARVWHGMRICILSSRAFPTRAQGGRSPESLVARFRTDSFGSGEERQSDAVSLLQQRVASAPNVTLLGAFSRGGPAAPVAAGTWGLPSAWIGIPAFSNGAGEGACTCSRTDV